MNTVHNQHLAIITWICKYFLVSGHACIETDFSGCRTVFTKSLTMVKSSICQNKNCRTMSSCSHIWKYFAKKTNISVRVWEYGSMGVRILLTFYTTLIHFQIKTS